MAAPDGATARRSDPFGFVDRVGFPRWAAILLVADIVGVVAVVARFPAGIAAPLAVVQIVVLPPLQAALVWSLRGRLGLSDPWRTRITALGLVAAALELVNAVIAAAGGSVAGPLNLLVLGCEGGWMIAFGVAARRGRTFSDQSPALAIIAGVGLLIAGLGQVLLDGATRDAVELVASVFVIAEFAWLFRLARTRPSPTLDPA
jgi:hypothetical protein